MHLLPSRLGQCETAKPVHQVGKEGLGRKEMVRERNSKLAMMEAIEGWVERRHRERR